MKPFLVAAAVAIVLGGFLWPNSGPNHTATASAQDQDFRPGCIRDWHRLPNGSYTILKSEFWGEECTIVHVHVRGKRRELHLPLGEATVANATMVVVDDGDVEVR